ncbi:uncharacterized protein LOC130307190 [Hyla sarda]|uniref:uncharacterized protein LOC130307190 n=1 Tax=Hyla sarda TaxID=327740 RepID=UPI0024C31C7D|nr:uncharacterized protein LOC130307190 [Hyla sarda]
MDFTARETAWRSQAENLFGTMMATGGSDSESTRVLKNSLRNLIHRRTKIWWNRTSLEQYKSRGLIPRGLRIQTFPAYGKEDEVFSKAWEEVCHKSAMTFIQLIVDLNTRTLDALSGEIDSAMKQLQEITSSQEYDIFLKEMEESFVVWEKQIQSQKSSKFQRDVNDYQNQKVYKWKFHTRTRSESVSSRTSRDTVSDISSIASTSSRVQPHRSKKNTSSGSSSRRRYERNTHHDNQRHSMKAELRQILNQAKDEDIITSKQYDSLWIDNPMIATFYLLPKIHKHATTPPGIRRMF